MKGKAPQRGVAAPNMSQIPMRVRRPSSRAALEGDSAKPLARPALRQLAGRGYYHSSLCSFFLLLFFFTRPWILSSMHICIYLLYNSFYHFFLLYAVIAIIIQLSCFFLLLFFTQSWLLSPMCIHFSSYYYCSPSSSPFSSSSPSSSSSSSLRSHSSHHPCIFTFFSSLRTHGHYHPFLLLFSRNLRLRNRRTLYSLDAPDLNYQERSQGIITHWGSSLLPSPYHSTPFFS